MGAPIVGEVWRRRPPGRERVRIGRVWNYQGEGPTVRAEPLKGGRYLVADLEWFAENYDFDRVPARGT